MSGSHISIEVDRLIQLTNGTVDDAYALLRSSRTRSALHVLSRCGSEVTLEEVVTAVARLQTETELSSVRVSLLHIVLPRLEDHGLLEYELRSETLRLDGPLVALKEPLGTRSERPARLEEADRQEPTG